MEYALEEIDVNDKDAELLDALVACWRASVEATHDFLMPTDVERIAAYVPDAMRSVGHLIVCRDTNGAVAGFVGVDGTMVEMLFINPDLRGCGLGTRLLDRVVREYAAFLVDVNEQNDQAVGFYLHYGFEVISRSDTDSAGDPFPILHMRLRKSKD